MRDNKKNFIDEARRLLDIIEETKITKKEDWAFVESIKSRVKMDLHITETQIFWLRDVKDRQIA